MNYNEQTRLYTVFGRIVPVMNRVRDGRNPSTGAFSAMARSGYVDLVKDYPIKENLIELTLPNSTGYSELKPTRVNSVEGFDDIIDITLSPNYSTPAASSFDLSNRYSSSGSYGLDTVDGEYVLYYGAIESYRLKMVQGAKLEINTPNGWLSITDAYCKPNGTVYYNGFLTANNSPVYDYLSDQTTDLQGYVPE